MMELIQLLNRIREGDTEPGVLEQARALVRAHDGLPDELRTVIDFRDDPEGDAVGLLAVLGADTLFGDVLREGIADDLAEQAPQTTENRITGDAERLSSNRDVVLEDIWPLGEVLAAAVRHEAGEVELVVPVFSTLGLPVPTLELAEAVKHEAGEADLAEDVLALAREGWVSAMVDGELSTEERRAAILRLREQPEAGAQMTAFASLGTDLRTSVREEAGEVPYIWEGVANALGVEPEAVPGWDGVAFAEALRNEAGSVDVAGTVMARIERTLPVVVVEPEALPEPANTRRWGGLLMVLAAAAVLLVAVPTAWNNPGAGVEPVAEATQFASAGEIVVENLDYGDNSNVYEVMGDDGALILWVDEGNVQ